MIMGLGEITIESGCTSELKWSMGSLPKTGEQECGDAYLIKKYHDKALVAAIDGLGHGKSASWASQRAKHLLDTSSNESIINLMNYCHKNLKNTRGVVMSLALVDVGEKTLTWSGVGNVEGVLLSEDEVSSPKSIILRHGIVGYKLPELQASIIPITMGDLLIFSTDGVRGNYLENVDTEASTKEIVGHITQNYFKRTDDALILAARFTGDENNG